MTISKAQRVGLVAEFGRAWIIPFVGTFWLVTCVKLLCLLG